MAFENMASDYLSLGTHLIVAKLSVAAKFTKYLAELVTVCICV